MKKLWSFYWFVIACFVAGAIIASMVEPYMGIIMLVLLLACVGFIVGKVYTTLSTRRRHF